ncbi:TadA family conjugal transfer-associated ATPase [Arachnia propionica]|uniref:TadA family conjugal transfer-associated ATPase n=1 Tax=Arachnia propionica TaxID=1750 RepID=A0A3P1T6U1_9ACTN|nr:TadA family conjugal transfer-associated ATPase [Arachnia propionica]MDO5083973.1 TadA family conjugal transfer-associated ATPase [Arachnia propionica]RRD05231.1 TadA family conjugal transfer-associated ATPase [Arachnia propionica]
MLDELQQRLGRLGRPHTAADVAVAMRAMGLVVTDRSLREALDQVRRHSVGAGPLEELLVEPGVTDVLVNGPDQVVVDRGAGLESTGITFTDDEEVRRLAIRLAANVGRRLDDAQPFVDARLPGGVRLHAVLAPTASPGTCISLRIPGARTLGLERLLELGSLTPLALRLCRALVASRVPYLVSGGTGTGKTTLLAGLLAEVPDDERIVLVEDSRELVPNHPHCVRLEARPANSEGSGAITLTTLVRQALRMRPDRLVLGEVRGAEVVDLLTALNTGHEGGCGTLHANSADDVPARLEALAALGGLHRDACHAQVASALRVVLHLRRESDGSRRLAEVGVVRRTPSGLVTVVPAWHFEAGQDHPGPGEAELRCVMGWGP